MGLNNENARMLVFDIETAPLDDAEQYLEPVEAPAHYKSPEAIAKYIADKQADQLARCALDQDLCRVVSIGMQFDDSDRVLLGTVAQGSEAELLAWWWEQATDTHLVGFNCIAFDLPVLLRRSLYLGVPAPQLTLNKYKQPGVSDLALLLSHNGQHRMRALSFYCKRFGIHVEDAIDGADIGRLVRAGLWDQVEAHCQADVRKTTALAQAMGLLRRAPVPASPLVVAH